MDLRTVFRAFNSAEAQLVRSQLEAAGFIVFVADETSALSMEGYVLGAGGIRVVEIGRELMRFSVRFSQGRDTGAASTRAVCLYGAGDCGWGSTEVE